MFELNSKVPIQTYSINTRRRVFIKKMLTFMTFQIVPTLAAITKLNCNCNRHISRKYFYSKHEMYIYKLKRKKMKRLLYLIKIKKRN